MADWKSLEPLSRALLYGHGYRQSNGKPLPGKQSNRSEGGREPRGIQKTDYYHISKNVLAPHVLMSGRRDTGV